MKKELLVLCLYAVIGCSREGREPEAYFSKGWVLVESVKRYTDLHGKCPVSIQQLADENPDKLWFSREKTLLPGKSDSVNVWRFSCENNMGLKFSVSFLVKNENAAGYKFYEYFSQQNEWSEASL